jgi:probable HAF family extracellular repeat protein
MKSKRSTCVHVIALLAALAVPLGLAAQNKQDHGKHHRYKLVDLGTLGGPNSSVLLGLQVLDNRGTVVGGAETSTPNPNYPNCNPLLGYCFQSSPPYPPAFIQHAFEWQKGALTDLGALPGTTNSYANWLNASGVTVGVSENGSIDPITGFPEVDAVVWKHGQITNLGTFGGNESSAAAVNNRGQVVGLTTNAIPDAFSGFGTQERAFLWENGTIQDLGTLGTGTDAAAAFVNEGGQVAGGSFTNTTANPITGIPTLDPFLWENGTLIDLGTLGGTAGVPSFLNNRGQVVGDSNLAGDIISHPFLWTKPGPMQDLGTFGGSIGGASWINDAGEVIGSAFYPGDVMLHGFLWRHGVKTDLGTVDGDLCSFPRYINSKGQIVGLSNSCQGNILHAFLWENGGPIVDLNTRIPPNSAVQLADAFNISDGGEIVAVGILANGDVHGFLLIPCDEHHPGVEGCDDSLIDARAVVPHASPAVRDASRPTLPPSLMRRMSRYHFPGFAIGSRN